MKNAPLRRAERCTCAILVGVAARPDEGECTLLLALDQRGVDGRREARIIELDREVIAAGLSGGLLPSGAEFGRAGEDAEVGCLLVVLLIRDELCRLDVEGEGLDYAGEAVACGGEGADGRHCRLLLFRAAPLRLDGDRKAGGARPAPVGPQRSGGRLAEDFLVSR